MKMDNEEMFESNLANREIKNSERESETELNVSFKDYVFKSEANKWYLRVALPVLLIQLVVFKLFYPFAGFINGDSYIYLETAYHNLPINTYPVGYSKLLRLISIFTYSDTAVVGFQYLLLQISALSFIFTIFYFYTPARITKILLFTSFLLNPVALYLANYISSDAFFLSLSLIWFTLLLWIMNRPTRKLILINAMVLFITFTVRYNALFYPIIGIVALFLTRKKILMNLVGFGISLLFIGWFIHASSTWYQQISGHRQFTPFTGWQMANNGMYAYRFVDSASRKKAPLQLKELDSMVRNYFDTSRDIQTHPVETLIASTVYMWDPSSPLTIYTEQKFSKDSTANALKKWATVAPLMKDYGYFLMRSYPYEFAKYYLVPNALKYYVPPVEFLKQYSTGIDSVNGIAKAWFKYKSLKIRCNLKDFNVTILDFYPILSGTMNVILVFSTISFILLKGYRRYPRLKRGLALVVALWVVNFGFSVFASPIALRFQLFPILVSWAFTFLLVEYMIKAAKGSSVNSGLEMNNNSQADAKLTTV